jgi:hypothetical protein
MHSITESSKFGGSHEPSDNRISENRYLLRRKNMQYSMAKSLVGCCGLYCGLCNKFQSRAPSRCKGCKLGEQHAWCSIWNCCVKKQGFETCTECDEIFKCEIFVRRKVTAWIPAGDNLAQIKKIGLERWLERQIERQALAEDLLENYNEGRSANFICKACARMPVNLIWEAVEESNREITLKKIGTSDRNNRAKILKSAIRDKANKDHINLD